jgi:uncharacterized damage-inducible protein DinB
MIYKPNKMANLTPLAIIKSLRAELSALLKGGNAHVSFQVAIKNLLPELRSKKIENVPYTIWQLVDHIRIAQHDILSFCTNSRYQSPKWPEDYWNKSDGPKGAAEWTGCIQQISDDRRTFINLVENEQLDLFTPFTHGEGQNLFNEAQVIADHTSYHTGEIILLRRIFGDWES